MTRSLEAQVLANGSEDVVSLVTWHLTPAEHAWLRTIEELLTRERAQRHGPFAAVVADRLAAEGCPIPREFLSINLETGEVTDARVPRG